MLLTRISDHEQPKKKIKDSQDNAGNNQPLLKNMNIPSDLNYIKPGDTQV